jgi:hypothetical protein
MPMAKKRWADLTAGQKAAIIVAGTGEVVLTTIALTDLAHRTKGGVRGPKLLWVLGCVVQPFGPMVYLALGRRGTRSVLPA